MISLDDIERTCSFLLANGRNNHIPTQMNAESTMELITRLRQAEKDAAKYRFVLEMAGVDNPKLIASLADVEIERMMSETVQCNK